MNENFENNNQTENEFNSPETPEIIESTTDNTDISENVQESDDKSNSGIGKEIWEWIYTIAIAVIIAFGIKHFIFDAVRVDGPSMFPTLENNDKLIVSILGYKPKAGDIIILDSHYKARKEYIESLERTTDKKMSLSDKILFNLNTPAEYKKRYYVKRIIALPGQTVDIDDDGNVLVDGKILEEEYYQGETHPIDSSVQFPITVEDDMVFVMGDNRPVSLDSRSSSLGQVPFDAILGKAQFRFWPFTSFGGLY